MNVDVSLPIELAEFIQAEVTAGHYTSSSEVVQEALRLLEQVERQNNEKLAFLRTAWREGIDSGDPRELDFETLKAEGRARLAAERA